jgi:hypothetical protein
MGGSIISEDCFCEASLGLLDNWDEAVLDDFSFDAGVVGADSTRKGGTGSDVLLLGAVFLEQAARVSRASPMTIARILAILFFILIFYLSYLEYIVFANFVLK